MNKIASAQTGIGNTMAKLWVPVLMASLLIAAILFAGACSDEPTEVNFPTAPEQDTNNWLFSVYGTSANNVYAAGSKGVMFHYDGNAENDWTLVNSGTDKAITSLWDAGDGTLYATGHGGVILRNSTGSWGRMTSGTAKDLYGIGRFMGQIYACGFEGTLRRLNGNTWGGTPSLSWILDETSAPTDTIHFSENVASLVTVNSFFIGGAYLDSRYTGVIEGMSGTKGGVFQIADKTIFPARDPETGAYSVLPDWVLRPISGEQIVDAEWILATTSDPDSLSRNFLGTSEGWLFQLSDARGDTVWTAFYPEVTDNPGAGIQSIWLDAEYNIYMVTDEGTIIFQTADYNYRDRKGHRDLLYDGTVSLTDIWGTDPNNLFVVGYMDDVLLHCSHDQISGEFTLEEIDVKFPTDKAMNQGPIVDKFGRPLF